MAYNEELAGRVRKALAAHEGLTEKKMFGGLSFMLAGNMCCGVAKDDLVVRVGADVHQKALTQPHTRPMDFTGRPMKGMVYVQAEGYRTDEALAQWVERGVALASSLAAKLP